MNDFMMRLATWTPKKALFFGAVATAVWYFVLYNDGSLIRKRIVELDQKIQTEKSRERESDDALREIAAVQASLGALSDQFKLVSAQLPTDLQMAEIIKTVDKVSQATGLNVKSKEPKPSVRQGVIEIVPLKVVAEGSFSDITMFFYYLSTIERIVRIKSFTMDVPPTKKPGSIPVTGKLKLEAEIVSYKFLPSEANKPPEAGKK